ncbi:MAG: protein kinase [Symploca sp. SIO2G7]|nr:protein kinase [Symploca sp. SIO2G7]
MSYCFNPHCPKPQNPKPANFCQNCGTKLLLAQRYRAIRLIATGGFGRTLLAEDQHKPSKPRCVIKQFYPQGQNNARKAAELFQQEAVRLEQLGKHPQIPELLAHLEQDNHQYIVQEFIDGQNLAQELAETGAFPESQIRSLLKNLLPVLQFIHQGQVIHRDIKPENIIRRRIFSPPYSGKDLVLVDFGAAKHATVTALAKTGTTIGSAAYAAPEQTFGKAVFTSDLYSLGVTCIHLLTNIEPFNLYEPLESGFAWRSYLVNNPVSEELGCILDKMIQNSIKLRYQSAEEVLQTLALLTAIPSYQEISSGVREKKGGAMSRQTRRMEIPPKILLTPSSESLTLSTKLSLITTFTKHSGAVYAVAFSPNGKIIASGSGDKTIKLWELSTEWELCTLGGSWFSGHSQKVRSIAFSPTGKTLASGSEDKTIKLWNVRTFQEFRTIKGHAKSVNTIAFSPDGKTLASGGGDKTIKLWRMGTGKEQQSLEHLFEVLSVAFSPDGNILASGSWDYIIRLWDVRTGQKICTFDKHLFDVFSVAFSPDGTILASGSEENTIKLWNLTNIEKQGNRQQATGNREENCISHSIGGAKFSSGAFQEQQTLIGHTNSVNAVVFSPDGKTLVSGSKDKTINLWDVSTGELLYQGQAHSDSVLSLAISPDGQTLASGSADGTIKIWQLGW